MDDSLRLIYLAILITYSAVFLNPRVNFENRDSRNFCFTYGWSPVSFEVIVVVVAVVVVSDAVAVVVNAVLPSVLEMLVNLSPKEMILDVSLWNKVK